MAIERLEPNDREELYELFALGLLEPEEMAEVRALLEAGDAEMVAGVRRALAAACVVMGTLVLNLRDDLERRQAALRH